MTKDHTAGPRGQERSAMLHALCVCTRTTKSKSDQ